MTRITSTGLPAHGLNGGSCLPTFCGWKAVPAAVRSLELRRENTSLTLRPENGDSLLDY